jgi:DNA helicase-2/ATP-dependent DNA helicase PcrA
MTNDDDIARLAIGVRRGSIVAAAGCGKTEQIARAVGESDNRRLVLTHTHAGVDAVTKRLRKYQIPTAKYRIATIAGWCLRLAASFPQRSGIAATVPTTSAEWEAVYLAGTRLLDSGAVDGVLLASYGGCFVDEYQDCTKQQHEVVSRLANLLPTCVFGDPMQAIFDFRGQQPVDWNKDVFPLFKCSAELSTPWRWSLNQEMADWVRTVRIALDSGNGIDLRSRPRCVSWTAFPADPRFHQGAVVAECLKSMREPVQSSLIVIADSTSENRRSALAQKLARQGFANLEPIGCKALQMAAHALDRCTGLARAKAVIDFASKCMTGVDRADLLRALDARQQGRRLGTSKFGALFPLSDQVISGNSEQALLNLLDALQDRPDTYLYRREMYFAMRSALQMKATRQLPKMSAAVWEVQNRTRHAGRRLGIRSIGSTLLVKGLEFDRAIVVAEGAMTSKDWYVALTRATRGVRIIARTEDLRPGRLAA